MVDGTSINVTSHCHIAVATPLSPQAARIRTNKANRFTFFSPFLKVIEHSVTVACRAAGAAPGTPHQSILKRVPHMRRPETSDCDTRRPHRVQPACPAPWAAFHAIPTTTPGSIGVPARGTYRLQAAASGIPRLISTSNPGPAARPAASLAAWVAGGRSATSSHTANHPGTPGLAAKRCTIRLGEIAKAAPELSPVTSGSISEAVRRPDWKAPCIHPRSPEACSPAK